MATDRIDLTQVQLYVPNADPILVNAEWEYTSSDLATGYSQQILRINDVFNRPRGYYTSNPDGLAADVATVKDALSQLQIMAVNGGVSANTPTSTKQYFLTTEMATNLDLLLRTFVAAGSTDPANDVTEAILLKWKDLSIQTPVIGDILRSAVNTLQGNRSIQALIELEYVRAGNELVNDQLGDLESGLTVNQKLIDLLGNLQQLRNNLVVLNRPTSNFAVIAGATTTNFPGKYEALASAHFQPPIFPIPPSTLIRYIPVSGTGNPFRTIPVSLSLRGQSIFQQLLGFQDSLARFLPSIARLVGATGVADPNSLYGRLKSVQNDLNTLFQFNGQAASLLSDPIQKATALYAYLTDRNDTANATLLNADGKTAGTGQQLVDLAITSAQNLNDTQKEAVRNFLFLFEEYYKSASAVLQRISQIIEKMAQNISR